MEAMEVSLLPFRFDYIHSHSEIVGLEVILRRWNRDIISSMNPDLVGDLDSLHGWEVNLVASDSIFLFNEDNMGAFVAWEYCPTIIAVCTGLLWEMVDAAVRRLEPYYQLSRKEGALVLEALSIDYITAFNVLVPFQSLRRRHWAVFLSSTIHVLSFSLLLTLSGIMWNSDWNFAYSTSEAVVPVKTSLVRTTQAVSGTLVVLGLVLVVVLNKRHSGLVADPAGIGGIASLISKSNIRRAMRDFRGFERQRSIDSAMQGVRFHLRFEDDTDNSHSGRGTSEQSYQIMAGIPSTSTLSPPNEPLKQSRYEAHPV
jgi:hypothetical protein